MFRHAAIEDADILLEWRNDNQTRKSSKNGDIITMEQHIKWLTVSLKNNKRKIYIVEYDGVPVGTIRTDYSRGVIELSWTVAPAARGKGIGKRMVAVFAGQIIDSIRAEIKVGNKASINIAKYAGMKLNHKENGILYYQRPAIHISIDKV